MKVSFPTTIDVQLATLSAQPPEGEDWLHEVKFDGYRIVALKNNNNVTLFSRNHLDWTAKFSNVVEAIRQLPAKQAVLDGEIVVLDQDGYSDFQLLQNAIGTRNTTFIYYVFDLLYLDQYDIRPLPLLERKALLQPLLHSDVLRYSDHIIGSGDQIFEQACKTGLEGIISKIKNSPYTGSRTRSWRKIKCIQNQEFVIGGFTAPSGSRSYFGALLLGVYDRQGNFIYCGRVGTGFNESILKSLYEKMIKITTPTSPFSTKPPGRATFVKPRIVVEIKFAEWTEEKHIRHGVYQGIRMDKKAKQVFQEAPVNEKKSSGSKALPKLTNPHKLLYPEDKISKQDIFDYYDTISDWILPWIINRPLTLVRCPAGYKKCFYQKHMNGFASTMLKGIPIEHSDGSLEDYIYLDDKGGLLTLVQGGVLEIHPWGSTVDQVDTPDMLIFDLDPGPDVAWTLVVKSAFLVREQLDALGLQSFVKTTGGKGLHVVLPVLPENNWNAVKNYTHVFTEYMEKIYPDIFVSNMAKSKRKGKIFLDYLRNQKNATAISPYSTRARPHAPVATPLDWQELTDNIEDTFYTLRTLPDRLQHLKKDPWKDFWKIRQSLKFEGEL